MPDHFDMPDLIRVRAYQLWESEGRPHGRDQAHWYQAERELGATAGARPVRRRVAASGGRSRKSKAPQLSA